MLNNIRLSEQWVIEEITEDIKNPQNQMKVKVQPSRLSGIHAGQV